MPCQLQQTLCLQSKAETKTGGTSAVSSSPADLKEKKKERILDLSRYMDKMIRVKFTGGREASGVLKGYDPLLNIVLDNTVEYLRGMFKPLLTLLFCMEHSLIYYQSWKQIQKTLTSWRKIQGSWDWWCAEGQLWSSSALLMAWSLFQTLSSSQSNQPTI